MPRSRFGDPYSTSARRSTDRWKWGAAHPIAVAQRVKVVAAAVVPTAAPDPLASRERLSWTAVRPPGQVGQAQRGPDRIPPPGHPRGGVREGTGAFLDHRESLRAGCVHGLVLEVGDDAESSYVRVLVFVLPREAAQVRVGDQVQGQVEGVEPVAGPRRGGARSSRTSGASRRACRRR